MRRSTVEINWRVININTTISATGTREISQGEMVEGGRLPSILERHQHGEVGRGAGVLQEAEGVPGR